jgi:four helix bundle protein
MDYKYSFEKLDVWQDARKFVTEIYKVSGTFPSEEKFGLWSQLQRASVSVVSNIAEGVSHQSDKE